MNRSTRTILRLALLLVAANSAGAWADSPGVVVTTVKVAARGTAQEIHCPARPKKAKAKAKGGGRNLPAEPEEPLDVPSFEDVRPELDRYTADPAHRRPVSQVDRDWLVRKHPGDPLRVAFWGDSHLATGVFTNELVRRLGLGPEQVQNRFVPAAIGRPGVRLPVRKACASSQWKFEPAYFVASGASAPGPGLVNLVSQQRDAWLAWDLRDAAGVPVHRQVSILYGRGRSPVTVAIRVDDGMEQLVQVSGSEEGPGAIELTADGPISVVRLRVQEGTFRLHGLSLPSSRPAPLVLDLFAYPGATAASWKFARLEYLSAWFEKEPYDLVVMEFGTNEGSVRPFDVESYRKSLVLAVQNLRLLFPVSACVLLGPGDRGVLVRRRGKKTAASPESGDFLRYSRVHDEIAQVQLEVARRFGCHAWNMFDAMGGGGSAYEWTQRSPALMSRDLIHFTPAGYRQLAGSFADDLGWGAHLVGPASTQVTDSRPAR